MKKRKQTTPLLSALTISMLCTSLAAAAGAHGIYQKYNTDGWSQPAIAVLMQGLANQDYPWKGAGASAGSGNAAIPSVSQPNAEELSVSFVGQPDLPAAGNDDTQMDAEHHGNSSGKQPDGTALDNLPDSQTGTTFQDSPSTQPGTAASDNASGLPGNTALDSASGLPGNTALDSASGLPGNTALDSASGLPESAVPDNTASQFGDTPPDSAAASQPAPRQYEFTDVTREYFDDALLIGDSRAEGVALYSGWDNLTYYTEGGMTIYNMFQRQVAKEDGQKISIEEALKNHTFGKIYLEIGINEMGTGTVDSFIEAYEGAVNHLRELQPDAILYLCGIMYVKQSKSESDPIFNNPNIQARNDRIAQLADGENIFYLDINELVTDETGNLNPDYTWDEVHLLGKYDSLWLDYFCNHGIVKEIQ